MAGLGTSVTELIKAVKLFSEVRSSFTDKYANSPALLQHFSQTVELFCQLCEEHNAVLEDRGERFDNPSSFDTTLNECRALINNYQVLLAHDRNNPAGWMRTALFMKEERRIIRLQDSIRMQMGARHFSSNIRFMARENSRQSISVAQGYPSDSSQLPTPGLSNQTQVSTSSAAQVRIRDSLSPTTNNPHSDPGHGGSETLINHTPSLPRRMSSISPPESLLRVGSVHSGIGHTISPEASPPVSVQARNATQPFCKVRVKDFADPLPLMNVPIVEIHGNGWDIVAYNSNLVAKYRHRILRPYGQTSHPVTFHRNNLENPTEDKLAVEITYWNQQDGDQHVSVLTRVKGTSRQESTSYKRTPKYIFSDKDRFKEFQSVIYGKTLLWYFDVDNITTSRSKKNNLASIEQLKLWKLTSPGGSHKSYLSFYANNDYDHRALEFSLEWFTHNANIDNKSVTIEVSPSIVSPPIESARRPPPHPQRSDTQRSDSTATSMQSSVFERRNTSASEGTAMTEYSSSSARSSASRASASGTTYNSSKRRLPTFLERARELKSLQINFMTEKGAREFQKEFLKLWEEDSTASTATSPVVNWQSGIFDPTTRLSLGEAAISSSPPVSPSMTGQIQPQSPENSLSTWPSI